METLKLDDLVSKLLTHEIHLQEEAEEHASPQRLVLKSDDIEIQSEKLENDEHGSMTMIATKFKKMFQKHLEFKEIRKRSSSRRNELKFKGKFPSKDNTNQNTCYDCGVPGRMIKDCPNIKKKNEGTGFKRKQTKEPWLRNEVTVIFRETKVKMKKLLTSVLWLEKAQKKIMSQKR